MIVQFRSCIIFNSWLDDVMLMATEIVMEQNNRKINNNSVWITSVVLDVASADLLPNILYAADAVAAHCFCCLFLLLMLLLLPLLRLASCCCSSGCCCCFLCFDIILVVWKKHKKIYCNKKKSVAVSVCLCVCVCKKRDMKKKTSYRYQKSCNSRNIN